MFKMIGIHFFSGKPDLLQTLGSDEEILQVLNERFELLNELSRSSESIRQRIASFGSDFLVEPVETVRSFRRDLGDLLSLSILLERMDRALEEVGAERVLLLQRQVFEERRLMRNSGCF